MAFWAGPSKGLCCLIRHSVERIRRATLRLWLPDARRKLQRFGQFLHAGERVLDIGSGNGSVTFLLRRRAIRATPLDVKNRSLADDLQPTLYNGQSMPFATNSFDTALLLTVLHHTSNPQQVIQEARRVARRIVIVEDIYDSRVEQLLTYAMDSVMNLQFFNHPRQNRPDGEWRDLFASMGLRLIHCRTDRLFLLFRQVTYVLEGDVVVNDQLESVS